MASILVIDDEPLIRVLLRMMFSCAGHQVWVALNGEAGLFILSQQPIDVVFCDLGMNGQGGLQTIRRIRSRFPSLGTVAVSGAPELLAEAAREGVGVLPKPFYPKEALAAVETVLASVGKNSGFAPDDVARAGRGRESRPCR
jgi:CheY-like chemotaxis protein